MAYKWIGEGVLRVGKKLIGYGKDIPTELSRGRLNKLIKKGKIGKLIEAVPAIDNEKEMLKIKTLEKEIIKLENELKKKGK
ncbi:hypothetical protein KAR10_07335 [bacterium]|nr:hypothetical protein [bacterium]